MPPRVQIWYEGSYDGWCGGASIDAEQSDETLLIEYNWSFLAGVLQFLCFPVLTSLFVTTSIFERWTIDKIRRCYRNSTGIHSTKVAYFSNRFVSIKSSEHTSEDKRFTLEWLSRWRFAESKNSLRQRGVPLLWVCLLPLTRASLRPGPQVCLVAPSELALQVVYEQL